MANQNIYSHLMRNKILTKLLDVVSIIDNKSVNSLILERIENYSLQLDNEIGIIPQMRRFDASIHSEADKIIIYNEAKQIYADTQVRELEIARLCTADLMLLARNKINSL